jgi:hypothetical protein
MGGARDRRARGLSTTGPRRATPAADERTSRASETDSTYTLVATGPLGLVSIGGTSASPLAHRVSRRRTASTGDQPMPAATATVNVVPRRYRCWRSVRPLSRGPGIGRGRGTSHTSGRHSRLTAHRSRTVPALFAGKPEPGEQLDGKTCRVVTPIGVIMALRNQRSSCLPSA